MSRVLFLNLLPYGFVVLGLAATAVLFLSLKRELRRRLNAERQRLDAILLRLQEAAVPSSLPPSGNEPTYVPSNVRSGINQNKRIQAIRLLRRGEDIAHVAAALEMQSCEVELVARVQNIAARAVAHTAGQ